MMTLGERIKAARLKAGVTKSALAEAADVSPSAVTQWENGDTKTLKSSSLLSAARILKVRYEWLADGKGPREAGELEPGPDIQGKVPLISWVQAGAWSSVVDNFQPGEADEWVETTVPIRQHTYALRVRGDSMTNPTGEEPTFPDGTKIVVEPDAIDTPDKLVGSLVIVKRSADDEATFKQLVKDAGRFYLKPINPRYPMLELREGDVLCGVVREKVVRYF
jgi:SOS-response transcriptional repressor LexA